MAAAPQGNNAPARDNAPRAKGAPALAPNFLRSIIAEDARTGKYGGQVVTPLPTRAQRLPALRAREVDHPELRLAAENGGRCHLRFDDTNRPQGGRPNTSPRSRRRCVGWATTGDRTSTTRPTTTTALRVRRVVIAEGLAYVDSQTAEEMRGRAGTLTEAGIASPWRDRGIAENLDLFGACAPASSGTARSCCA